MIKLFGQLMFVAYEYVMNIRQFITDAHMLRDNIISFSNERIELGRHISSFESRNNIEFHYNSDCFEVS